MDEPTAQPFSSPASNGLDSWWGVLLVSLMLVGVVAGIVGAWWRIAPVPPDDLERYLPLSNGLSLLYRITPANGDTFYQSTNVELIPGSDILSIISPSSFGSLMSALGQDLDNLDQEAALTALSEAHFARVVETNYAVSGFFTTTTTIFILGPTSTDLLQLGQVAFDPPLSMFVAPSADRSRYIWTGLINGIIPYTSTLTLQKNEAIDTPVGHLEDCLPVRHRFVIPGYDGYDRTWYCAGIGIGKQDVGITNALGVDRYELVAVSAPGLVAAADPPPPLPASREQGPAAQLNRSFPQAGQGEPILHWSYLEERLNSGITTPVLPIGDLLVYGTQSGGLVALDREQQTPRWRFQTGSAIYSAPVVADGLVFVASSDRKLYAVDLVSGAFRWAFASGDAIAASPAAAEGVVYVASEDSNVYALDAASGQERWRFSTGGPVVSAPVVVDNTLYVGSDDGVLYALDSRTGRVLWAYATGGAITMAPTVAGDIVYVGSHDKNLYALKAQTDQREGELVWRYYARVELLAEVLVSEGLLYLIAGRDLYALDAADGLPRWHYPSMASFYGEPLRLGEQILVRRGYDILALDAQTGVERSITPTGESSAHAGLGSDGSRIFVSYFDGRLDVFELERSAP